MSDICTTCNEEPYFPRCPECRAIPLSRLHDMCREPLRQLAQDMCRRSAERRAELDPANKHRWVG